MQPLKCPGVGRDKDNLSALQFYFSRRVTDDEMRFLHEVIQRAVACLPKDLGVIRVENSCGCVFCDLGLDPFNAEGIMWHQTNGRDPVRCTKIRNN